MEAIKTKLCLWCGKPVGKYRRKFCSDDCQQENFINNIAPLWWRNAVEIALARAGNKCEECGSMDNLQVHHKEPLRGELRHGNEKNRQDNLIVLCKDCHWRKHRGNGKQSNTERLLKAGQLLLWKPLNS